MRIHHLNCGTLRPAALGGRAMVCHCLLIETDDAGLVLVDSGLGACDLDDPKARLGRFFSSTMGVVRDPALSAISQVRALGHRPEDVRHIVLTHMDLDHAGGLVDFPSARVHVHRAEHEVATTRPTFMSRQRYSPAQWAHGPAFRTYADHGEPWFGFDAVRQLDGLPPEILLIPLFGHSRGHTAVAVDTGAGWLLHAGDAYFDQGEVHAPRRTCPPLLRAFQSIIEVDRKARLGNQDRLRALAGSAPEVTIFSAHDERELPRPG